ncbi:MAG: hypothetical protein WC872_03800 [Candidatus Absconditabacterales bacterium]
MEKIQKSNSRKSLKNKITEIGSLALITAILASGCTGKTQVEKAANAWADAKKEIKLSEKNLEKKKKESQEAKEEVTEAQERLIKAIKDESIKRQELQKISNGL